MKYPNSEVPDDAHPQIWEQSVNPVAKKNCGPYKKGRLCKDYVAVDVNWIEKHWGGLERNRPGQAAARSFLDGSVAKNDWWYAIAVREKWSTGVIPGPGHRVNVAELYAWVP